MLSIAIIFLTIRTFFQQFFGTITIKVAKSEIFTNDVKNINWIDAFLHPPLQSILSCLSNFMFLCCKKVYIVVEYQRVIRIFLVKRMTLFLMPIFLQTKSDISLLFRYDNIVLKYGIYSILKYNNPMMLWIAFHECCHFLDNWCLVEILNRTYKYTLLNIPNICMWLLRAHQSRSQEYLIVDDRTYSQYIISWKDDMINVSRQGLTRFKV